MSSSTLRTAAGLILGEASDVSAEVKQRTPERFALAWEELLSGYQQECAVQEMLTSFEKEGHQHLVAVSGIDFFSVCEHHLLPFWGKAAVGYIPDERIIGASKLPRLVEIYSRRLQLQERLTHQIAQALLDYLHPLGVAVVLRGQHMCMMMRGVRKVGCELTTSEMLGVFQDEPAARAEFLSLYRNGG